MHNLFFGVVTVCSEASATDGGLKRHYCGVTRQIWTGISMGLVIRCCCRGDEEEVDGYMSVGAGRRSLVLPFITHGSNLSASWRRQVLM